MGKKQFSGTDHKARQMTLSPTEALRAGGIGRSVGPVVTPACS